MKIELHPPEWINHTEGASAIVSLFELSVNKAEKGRWLWYVSSDVLDPSDPAIAQGKSESRFRAKEDAEDALLEHLLSLLEVDTKAKK